MKWFRFYAEALQDPKVQALPPPLFKGWINLLCLASDQDDRGSLPPLANIAFVLHTTPNRAEKLVADQVDRGLIDEDDHGYRRMHAWDDRQSGTDTSAERVARYRDRLRANGETVTGYTKHRKAVLARDGHACAYCGETRRLVLDHMVPVARGGDSSPDNLAAACKACSSGKAGRLVEEAGYTFADPAAESRYVTVKSRLGVTAEHAPVTDGRPPVTPDTVTRLAREESKSRAERERELEPPCGGKRPGPPPAAAEKSNNRVTAEDCVELTRALFGPSEAARLRAKRADVDRRIGGRWDCYAAALREIDRRRKQQPGARDIGNLIGYAVTLVPDFLDGVPPPPAPVGPAGQSPEEKARRRAELIARLPTDEEVLRGNRS